MCLDDKLFPVANSRNFNFCDSVLECIQTGPICRLLSSILLFKVVFFKGFVLEDQKLCLMLAQTHNFDVVFVMEVFFSRDFRGFQGIYIQKMDCS